MRCYQKHFFHTTNYYCRTGNELPLEKSGCCNYFTVGWITNIMIKAYKSGLSYTDLFRLPAQDQSKDSASRLQRLWVEEQEKAQKANRAPTFWRACAKFCLTRVSVASVFFSGSVILQFLAPVICLAMLAAKHVQPSLLFSQFCLK